MEKHRLRECDSRVLRATFGSENEEVTGEWRKLCDEALHDLYFPLNCIQMMKSRRQMKGSCGLLARKEEYKSFIKISERTGPVKRPRWEDIIKWFLYKWIEGCGLDLFCSSSASSSSVSSSHSKQFCHHVPCHPIDK
jgi:hypothetical protein